MGTVHQLRPGAGEITLAQATAAHLATLDHPETQGTHRMYAMTYRALQAQLDADTTLAGLTPEQLREAFVARWGEAKPATWGSKRGAVLALLKFCAEQGWIASAADLGRGIEHRRIAADRSRALSRAQIEDLLGREDIPIRERTLWRMLYETAARSAELLRLNVEDLDRPNRQARVTRKGGAQDVVVWQTGTARLLPRLLQGRETGPVFLTERRARVELPPGDIDPASGRARLSYSQAEQIFKAATGGCTLHQLRHSALTHGAEDGTSAMMLMVRSGHTSLQSLARYARPSAEALARHQAATDPARRR